MLQISGQALGALEEQARPGFLAGLTNDLAEEYPHFLQRFPIGVQQAIVANMVARAERWGITRANALAGWCNLMIEVAANFDEDADVAAMLRQMAPDIDRAIFEIGDALAEPVWDRVDRNASVLPFFLAPSITATDPRDRTTHAIPLVLGDRPDARNPVAAVQAADPVVRALKLTGLADAWLVVAGCNSLLGRGFERAGWMRDTAGLAPGRPLLEALRLRLLLFTGRWL